MAALPVTKEQQVREIVACGKDPVYFMKRYAKIQHATRGLLPFETYEFQDECVASFEKHRKNIVLKARQMGLSTVTAAYAAWYCIFYKDKTVLVIATKLSTAMNFIKKVKVIIDNLPPWLLLPKYEPSKQSIRFSNGSSITATPTSEDAGRSEALSLLIIDEAAIIKNFDELWTGLLPTISTGGRAIILSTPYGVGGTYYKLWTEAEAGVNDFNPIRLPWDRHPEHDQLWFDKETKGFGKKKIAQEFLCDFISSGDTFLQPEDLDYIHTTILQPLSKEGYDKNIWVWLHPIEAHTYVVSADVARGDASDYSAFHVIDTANCEVVAEYMGKIPPEKFAEVLNEWARKYNTALIAAENNTFGYFVNTKLRDTLAYPKMYYQHRPGDQTMNYTNQDDSKLPGFSTQGKSRVQVLAKLEETIRNKTLKIYSQRTHDQLQAFVWNGSKPMASKDAHDDLILSLAIGVWLTDDSSGVNEQAAAMSYAILKATSRSQRDIYEMPGETKSIQALVNPAIRGSNPHQVHKPRNHNERRTADQSDFSWLLR
jgi:hypothetical protein